jgi:pilus assembly protein TadC
MRAYTNAIENLLQFNDIEFPAKKFSSILVVVSAVVSFLIAAFIYNATNMVFAVSSFILAFFMAQATAFMTLYFQARSRADYAEEYLPNLLELISTNIKSGMTPDKALLYCLKGESGPFRKNLRIITKESMTIKPLETALLDISKRYNSDLIHNSMILIAKGVRGGGNLSTLLDRTAQDIREVRSLKKEVLADVNLHALFLVFAAIVGAPLLFGTTSFLIDEIVWISEKTSNVFFTGQGKGFFYFAVAAVALNAFFASLLLGTIKEGRKREGLKYLPMFLALALGLLFLVRYVMQAIFFAISI